jgi:hypothetical protein
MTDPTLAHRPVWEGILRSPPVRSLVLGSALFYLMGRAQSLLDEFHDAPLIDVPVQIAVGLLAIALYVVYGRVVERREVTELATPGLVRE